jgi:hypothetical protein
VSSSILQAPLPRPSRSSPLTALLGPLPPSLTIPKIPISTRKCRQMLVLIEKYRHLNALTFHTASPFAWRHGRNKKKASSCSIP